MCIERNNNMLTCFRRGLTLEWRVKRPSHAQQFTTSEGPWSVDFFSFSLFLFFLSYPNPVRAFVIIIVFYKLQYSTLTFRMYPKFFHIIYPQYIVFFFSFFSPIYKIRRIDIVPILTTICVPWRETFKPSKGALLLYINIPLIT